MSMSISLPMTHASTAHANSIHRCIVHPAIAREAAETPTIDRHVDEPDPDCGGRRVREHPGHGRNEIGVQRTGIVDVLADAQ